MLTIPPEVAHHLGFYIYLYIDPRDQSPFYVGKGQNNRILAHFDADEESAKIKRINEIRAAGFEPRLDILAHKLPDEESAFRIEGAIIDVIGLDSLTNKIRGKNIASGRMSLSQLIHVYASTPIEIIEPSILFRINKKFRHDMTALELYEVTRGVWKVGQSRYKAQYAFAIYEGVIKAVYEIQSWEKAGTAKYTTRDDIDYPDRWEFTGILASEEVNARYLDKSVAQNFKRGDQGSFKYVNI